MKALVFSVVAIFAALFPSLDAIAGMPEEFRSVPFSQAIEEGKKAGKPVWLYLSRYNCTYCSQVEAWVRGNEKLREAHRGFVYSYSIGAGIRGDDGKGEHNDLRARFKVFAYPLFVFFDMKGDFLCRSHGYDRPDIGIMIAQMAKTMQAEEAEKIAGPGLRSCSNLLPRQ